MPMMQSLRAAILIPAVALALGGLGGCASWWPTSSRAVPESASAPGHAASAPPALTVQAPAPAKALLEQHLNLARAAQIRSDEALDDAELARLIASTPAQSRELLQTEGWFEPEVTVSRLPYVAVGARAEWLVKVNPGPRTTVKSLELEFDGPFKAALDAHEPAAQALRASLSAPPVAQPGAAFRNAEWTQTKLTVLERLRLAGYAAAQLPQSSADVDVAAHQAELHITLSSGPRFRSGALQIEGLRHHDAATVQHLAGFGPGTPLTDTLLLDYQDRLIKSGLFDTATVSYDPDPAKSEAAVVTVKLSERSLQQAQVGVGYSANTGPRVSLEHTHRRPLGYPLVVHNKAEWGRDSQSFSGDITTHPGEGFYRNLAGVQIERVLSPTDVVLSQRLRLGRTTDTPRFERLYYVEALNSRRSDSLGVTSAQAVSGNLNLVLRDLDSVLLPTRGISLAVQGGLGEAASRTGRSGPFFRAYGRLTGYLPLGGQWYGQARLEAGQIYKQSAVQVPDALGFRAGGDDSVRGYAYRSLAPSLVRGTTTTTISGEVLLTGSLEIAHPISANLPSVWGAAFIDAGRASARWADYSAAIGYGVGVRWRSPIGPLRADLAWGDELRRLRLHFSVGIAF